MEEKNVFILRSNSSIVKATRGGTRRREGRIYGYMEEAERERERESEAWRVEERVKGGPTRVGRGRGRI